LHILAIYLHYPTHRATTPQFLRSRASWCVQLGIFLRAFAIWNIFLRTCAYPGVIRSRIRTKKSPDKAGHFLRVFPRRHSPSLTKQNTMPAQVCGATRLKSASSLRVPVAPMIMN